MPAPDHPRVFISYSRKDGYDFAQQLHALLKKRELSVYRDLSHLEGGLDWWRQVEGAIKAVEHLVLVLTPKALESPSVRAEWRLARQEGKTVWPVVQPDTLDFSGLPHWMVRAHRHDIAIPDSRERLIFGLKGASQQRRVPFMADALPAGFVRRPKEFEEIKRWLLDSNGDPVAITAGLLGAGGFGKTSLANALCHDPDVQDAFSDGILRVTLGEKPDDLVGLTAELIVMLTGQRPDVTRLDTAKTRLAEALDDRRCLLVIDDAWRTEHLAPYLHRGPRDNTARLITTRDRRVLPGEAVQIEVDAMTSAQALEMFRDLPDAGSRERQLQTLATRLGEWPLLLGLTRGVLQSRISSGASLATALDYVDRSLDRRGLGAAFRIEEQADRRKTAAGTLALSTEQLAPDEGARFEELSVFVEDAEIPIPAALGLWKQTAALDPLDGEDLLARLDQLSLLIDFDLGRGAFRVHDVFRELVREKRSKTGLAELDRELMAHFRSMCPDGDLAHLTDLYGLRHAIDHLRQGGEEAFANGLLLDAGWIQAKLNTLGIQSVLSDYSDHHEGTAQGMIGAALALAANALARRPRELAAQIIARLDAADAPELDACLAKARQCLQVPALVPLRPTFTTSGGELRRFEGHRGAVNSVAVLADGRSALSASSDCTLCLWDLDTGAELRRFEGHEGRVTTFAVLADGRRALSISDDRTLRLWDLHTGAELRRFEGHVGRIRAVAVLADGRRALSASDDRTLCLWKLETGAALRTFKGHKSWINSVALLADRRRALSASDDSTLRLWNLETGAELRRFEGHKGPVKNVVVLAGGRRVLSTSDDRTLRLWNLEAGTELERFEGHDGTINSVAMLADGERAISASGDCSLRLWDLETGAELRRFEGHEDRVRTVAVLADGRRALSSSDDGSLRLWDLETGAELRRFEGHEGWVNTMSVLADGRRALSASGDCTLRLWDLDTSAELRHLEGRKGRSRTLALLADGRRALSSSADSTLRVWDLETGAGLRRFQSHGNVANSVAVLADGRCALSTSDNNDLQLWNLDTGAELRRFKGHKLPIRSVAVLARRALSASDDNTLRLWDLDTGTELRRFDGRGSWFGSVAVLVDGQRALSSSGENTLNLWDLDTGAELRRLRGHGGWINSVMVLANGRRALSGSDDNTLRLWDLDTGAELQRYEGHKGAVNGVAVLADGRRALSTSDDRTLRLWNLDTGAEVATLTFDAAVVALSWSEVLKAAVVDDALGRAHVVKLIDTPVAELVA